MNRDKAAGATFELAIGDTVVMPVKFRPRGKFEPVTEFRAGGPFKSQAGQWTYNTAVSLYIG